MNKLTYDYTTPTGDKKKLEIELLDSEFVQEWLGYLARTANRLPNLGWKFFGHTIVKSYNIDPQPLYRRLNEAFTFLDKHFADFDYTNEIAETQALLDNKLQLTQDHLNRFHRHFTTFATEYYHKRLVIPEGVSDAETFAHFHALNQNVHDLEALTYPQLPRRARLGNRKMYSVNSAHARNLDDSNKLWLSGHTEMIKMLYDFVGRDYRHTVWLNEDIQGKDHFKCYYDEDDASNGDIWGNSFMTPNIMFDPGYAYADTLDDPEFVKFYKMSGKPLNRWPMGDVVDIENVNWEEMTKSEVDTITLNDQVLWSFNA
jgi:hypothetical protein